MAEVNTRWHGTEAPRGDAYDRRWQALAEQGRNIHGEADLITGLLGEYGGDRVLDAGCGTGRVAIELANRGIAVTGIDADEQMLAGARAKAPGLTWERADLADLGELPGVTDSEFDLIALAGNVMIFLTPGTEAQVLDGLGALLAPGGLLVAGFQIRPDRLGLADYDRYAQTAGLRFLTRWATWDREPFTGGDYAVTLHQR
jgi:SAM-dependent methyltransferase